MTFSDGDMASYDCSGIIPNSMWVLSDMKFLPLRWNRKGGDMGEVDSRLFETNQIRDAEIFLNKQVKNKEFENNANPNN